MPAELKIIAPPAWKYKLIAYRGQEGADPSLFPPSLNQAYTVRRN